MYCGTGVPQAWPGLARSEDLLWRIVGLSGLDEWPYALLCRIEGAKQRSEWRHRLLESRCTHSDSRVGIHTRLIYQQA